MNETEIPSYQSTPLEEDGADQASQKRDRDWLADRKDEVKHLVERTARKCGETAKSSVSSKLHKYNEAIRAASESLEQHGETRVSGLIGQASERLESTTKNIEDASYGEMIDTAEEYVAKAPWLTLGLAAVAGLVLSRITTTKDEAESTSSTTSERATPNYDPYDHDA